MSSKNERPMRIVLMGTRGVPARYGGFETAMEEIGSRLVDRGHQVTVYCRNGNSRTGSDPDEYLGMHLVHLTAMRLPAAETLSHTFLSVWHLLRHRGDVDVVVLCNAANSVVLPFLHAANVPTAVHVDGLEWARSKWNAVGKAYYRVAESLAVRWADALIADACGIESYYREEFGATSAMIPYGVPVMDHVGNDRLSEVDVKAGEFHLIVARFEPENHVHLMMKGYLESSAQMPLVVVGSATYPTEYSQQLDETAQGSAQIKMLGGVWDQDLLDQLYAGALTYLHGHSVGGTNPSLLRAMRGGTYTIAYDVIFNREVTGTDASFVRSAEQVARALEAAEEDPTETAARGAMLSKRAARDYDWDQVAKSYENLCRGMFIGGSQRGRFTGRRAVSSQWRQVVTPAGMDAVE